MTVRLAPTLIAAFSTLTVLRPVSLVGANFTFEVLFWT